MSMPNKNMNGFRSRQTNSTLNKSTGLRNKTPIKVWAVKDVTPPSIDPVFSSDFEVSKASD